MNKGIFLGIGLLGFFIFILPNSKPSSLNKHPSKQINKDSSSPPRFTKLSQIHLKETRLSGPYSQKQASQKQESPPSFSQSSAAGGASGSAGAAGASAASAGAAGAAAAVSTTVAVAAAAVAAVVVALQSSSST